MTYFKTLKDIYKIHDKEIADGEYWMNAFLGLNRDLKQEAIKHIKKLKEIGTTLTYEEHKKLTPLLQSFYESDDDASWSCDNVIAYIMWANNLTEGDMIDCIAILANSRQVLVEQIKRTIGEKKMLNPDIVLSITSPCGKSVEYKTYEDIPNKDVPCSCGNFNHWFIKYKKDLK